MGIASGDRQYALQSLIGEQDSMADVVAEITSQYGSLRGQLAVIRIECHGIETPGAGVFGLEFGRSMNASDVSAFRKIQSLWSHQVSLIAESHLTVEDIVPRIEFHACAPVHGCNAILQALANASDATVFASNVSQDVDARRGSDPFAFEGEIFRFIPGETRPRQIWTL